MSEDEAERALKYRRIAAELRLLAEKIQYDYRYQDQIRALADGFERYAARFDLETPGNGPNDRR